MWTGTFAGAAEAETVVVEGSCGLVPPVDLLGFHMFISIMQRMRYRTASWQEAQKDSFGRSFQRENEVSPGYMI